MFVYIMLGLLVAVGIALYMDCINEDTKIRAALDHLRVGLKRLEEEKKDTTIDSTNGTWTYSVKYDDVPVVSTTPIKYPMTELEKPRAKKKPAKKAQKKPARKKKKS